MSIAHPVEFAEAGNGTMRVKIIGECRDYLRIWRSHRLRGTRKAAPAAQFLLRLLALLLRPVHRLSVVRPEHHEADHLARHALIEQIPHGEEVAEGLRHLLALDLEHLVVEPDLRHAFGAVRAAALRALVLVVGKEKVAAAAVDVERVAQKRLGHRRAFDVPARAAPAPW